MTSFCILQSYKQPHVDYRQRGIATALKVKAAEFAQQVGAATIMTMNEESNPMYQLNVQLGFKPLPTWITYKREFGRRKG